jgi:hypothetical protein
MWNEFDKMLMMATNADRQLENGCTNDYRVATMVEELH